MKLLFLIGLLGLTQLGDQLSTHQAIPYKPTIYQKKLTQIKTRVGQKPEQPRDLYVLADSIMQFLQEQNSCIPWDYPEDYCFARAHATYILVRKEFGVDLGKMYLYPPEATQTIKIRVRLPTYTLYDSARWNGHVTVFLASKTDTLIIDPALTDKPAGKADYLQLLSIRPEEFKIDYSGGGEYCSVCQPKFNYRGKEALEITRRALRENYLRRSVFVKETEINRHYVPCTDGFLSD